MYPAGQTGFGYKFVVWKHAIIYLAYYDGKFTTEDFFLIHETFQKQKHFQIGNLPDGLFRWDFVFFLNVLSGK
jgi:hypothetical protein